MAAKCSSKVAEAGSLPLECSEVEAAPLEADARAPAGESRDMDSTILLEETIVNPGVPILCDAKEPILSMVSVNPKSASTFDVVRGSFTILPDLPSLSERAVAARTLRISCGRAKDNTVVIGDDTRISTLHFVISVCATPGGCVLLELTDQSSNGTWHNGQRMVRGRGVPMAVGDTVTVLPIDQVGRDSEVGFLLVRDVRGAWCSKCPVTSPASSPREGPPAEERGSPGREAPAEQVPRTLERDLHCGICRDALHQCLTVVPCGHNFCGVCLAKWRRTSSACPECRGSIVQAVRNQTVDRLVETFLCAHPDAARSQEDLAAMEAAARDPDHRYMMRWLVQPPALRPTAASVRAAPTPVRRQPQPAEQPARSGAAAPQPPLAEGQQLPAIRTAAAQQQQQQQQQQPQAEGQASARSTRSAACAIS